MHYNYNVNEQAPLHQNIQNPPPLYNVNLPGRSQDKLNENNIPIYIDPNINFNNIQQNPTDNSFLNNSYNAPLMQTQPNNYPNQMPTNNYPNQMPTYSLNMVHNNVIPMMINNNNNFDMHMQIRPPIEMIAPSMPMPQMLPPQMQNQAYQYVNNNNQQQQANINNNNSGYAIGTTVNVVDALIPKSGFEKLMVPGIFVKQKMEWLEIFSGCETENKYKVYACDVAGNKEGHPLFKCREKSTCIQRQCLPGDCRKFKLDVTHDSEGKFSMDGEIFLEVIRPFKFTCFCFQRPFVEVNYREGGKNQYIGRILHNFDLCNMHMTLLDKTNKERYTIVGSIFQIGLMNQRGCPCKGCQQAFCFIHDNTGEIVGIIEKRGKGFKGMISDADNFSILFPIKSTLEERACILAATLFLDFRYFEDNENNRNSSYY